MTPMHRTGGEWLVLLFLMFGVLLPTGAVLWFMNQAADNQAEAAQRSVTEAYRGQLRLLRDRVQAFWQSRVAALDKQTGSGTGIEFNKTITSGLADSIIYFDSHGIRTYPASPPLSQLDPVLTRADWRHVQSLENASNWASAAALYETLAETEHVPTLAARAAQGQVRCLLQTGDSEAAIRTIQKWFLSGTAAGGADAQGRLIAADEQLLGLRLMKAGDLRRVAAEKRLVALINDYSAAVPSAQRLFLMDELALPSSFPTGGAEKVAAEFLQTDSAHEADPGLTRSRLPGIWKLSSSSSRYIALFRTDTVIVAMRTALEPSNASPGVHFAMIAPGASGSGDAIAAGPLLPGWQIAFSLADSTLLKEVGRRRRQSYLWIGYLVVAAMALASLIGWHAMRRQWRLTRVRTDLVSAVSHELKTPLASMRLLVDSLLEDDTLDPQKTRDYLRLVAGENQRLTRLIENFLTFSRIERNRQSFEFADVHADDIAQAAVQLVQERHHGCGVKIAMETNIPPFRADRDALVTALLNLLDNAYKYSPGDKQVELSSFREDTALVFAVKDRGIGITHRDQKRIFRKFYQVDQRLSRETGGCGLGLSIVDFIVRAHGGRVAVESRLGTGSTFRIVLPLDRNGSRTAA